LLYLQGNELGPRIQIGHCFIPSSWIVLSGQEDETLIFKAGFINPISF